MSRVKLRFNTNRFVRSILMSSVIWFAPAKREYYSSVRCGGVGLGQRRLIIPSPYIIIILCAGPGQNFCTKRLR